MHIRILQALQRPWNVNDFQHALFHGAKAIGKLAGLVDDADHDVAKVSNAPGSALSAGPEGWSAEELFADVFDPKKTGKSFVGDLVVIALKLAERWPGGAFDLEEVVVARMREKGTLAPVEGSQAEREAKRTRQAEELVFAQNLQQLPDAKRFAAAWIETALQYADNEGYWRDRAEARNAPGPFRVVVECAGQDGSKTTATVDHHTMQRFETTDDDQEVAVRRAKGLVLRRLAELVEGGSIVVPEVERLFVEQ